MQGSTRSETILLVEDEETVRRLTCDILSSSGYEVLIAKNGEEAIDICKRHRGNIDLMLTDVVMPGMNGKQAAESVMSHREPMQVLYMSGYTDDAIVRQGVLDPGTNFIEKPFTAQGLIWKVREMLDKESRRQPRAANEEVRTGCLHQ
jgi:two-component system, cell cycle sensor histidine kinase and response regulator CckA